MPASVQVSKYEKTMYNQEDDLIVISNLDVEEMGADAGEKKLFLIKTKCKYKDTNNLEKLKYNFTNYYYYL